MKSNLECPYCDAIALLIIAEAEHCYRRENFRIFEHFYKCPNGHEFTTEEVDTFSITQIHNLYREKHLIPFQEEIKQLRVRYELSASKMSVILGLGANGYSNYENGEVPTPAIGNLIYTIVDPKIFKIMLNRSKESFSTNSFDKISRHIDNLINELKNEKPFYYRLNKIINATRETGFRKINANKIASTIIFFITHCNSKFNDRIKLNKLLFYSDFVNYKNHGYSITGLSYRAVKYGPVPTCYDNIFTFLENEEFILSEWKKEPDGSAREIFLPIGSFDRSIFIDEEINILNMIVGKFGETPSFDLVELSHEEPAWINFRDDATVLIDYHINAFSIKAL